MQDSLDIFDVAHGHPVAEQELAVLVEEGELLSKCQNRLTDLSEAYQDLLAQYHALSLQCADND